MIKIKNAKCPVCQEFFLLQGIVFFQCGHGLCKDGCLTKLQNDKLCPVCRRPKIRIEGRPNEIFLQVDDNVEDRIASITDTVGRIPGDASAVTIAKTGDRLLQLSATSSKINSTTSKPLFHAIGELLKRISQNTKPLAEVQKALDKAEEENSYLQTQIQELTESSRKDRLAYNERLEREKEEVKRLKSVVERWRLQSESKEQENQNLKEQLQKSQDACHIAKTKAKALARQKERPRKLSVPEDEGVSLLVEPPNDSTPNETRKRSRIKTSEGLPVASKRSRES